MFAHMISRNRNIILQSKHGRPFLADVYYTANADKKPVVIFNHGFKGFKDWGPFNLVAEKFAQAGLWFDQGVRRSRETHRIDWGH